MKPSGVQEVIRLEDQHYILATSSRIVERTHVLKHGEYVQLLANYRNHHWPQEASTLGLLTKMGFSTHLYRLVQPVLDAYLRDQKIIVLPQTNPEPAYPYQVAGVSGMRMWSSVPVAGSNRSSPLRVPIHSTLPGSTSMACTELLMILPGWESSCIQCVNTPLPGS